MLNIREILTATLVLFAVIDVIGAIPVIVGLKGAGRRVHAGQAAVISFALMTVFLFAGEAFLRLFNVDIASFAIAGALILFALAIEMLFDVHIFKAENPEGSSSTLVPVVFPLIAGAGTLTTTLSLRAEVHSVNIVVAVAVNMVVVYLVLRHVGVVERVLGKGAIYILRKFFGVLLLAMAIRLFMSNLTELISSGSVH